MATPQDIINQLSEITERINSIERNSKRTQDFVTADAPLKGTELIRLVDSSVPKKTTVTDLINYLRSFIEEDINSKADRGDTFGGSLSDLKDLIDQINIILTSDDTSLDELQEIVSFIKQNKTELENLSSNNIAGLSDALEGKEDKLNKQSDITSDDPEHYPNIQAVNEGLKSFGLKKEETFRSVQFYSGTSPNGGISNPDILLPSSVNGKTISLLASLQDSLSQESKFSLLSLQQGVYLVSFLITGGQYFRYEIDSSNLLLSDGYYNFQNVKLVVDENTPVGANTGANINLINSISTTLISLNLDLKTDTGGSTLSTQDLKDEIDALSFEGIKTYTSVSQLNAERPNPSEFETAIVNNRSISDDNGKYSVVNGTWTKYRSLVENEIDINNTTEAVSGFAVSKPLNEISNSLNKINNSLSQIYSLELSPNLLDFDNNLLYNSFVNSGSGQISNASGWGCIFVDVSDYQGQQITFSGSRERVGYSFHSDETEQSFITGTYSSSNALPITLTVPDNAVRFYANVYSPSQPNYSNIQIELGDEASDYSPFGSSFVFNSEKLDLGDVVRVDNSGKMKVVLNNDVDAISYLENDLNGKTLTRRLRASRNISDSDRSASIELENTLLDNVLIHSQFDEAAPLRILSTTIGANHGYIKTRVTLVSHGKTNADIGSLWIEKNTNKEFVLINIRTVNSLEFSSRTDNGQITENLLTHVSGGVNTSNVDCSVKTSDQWYNVIQNHKKVFYLDGKEVSDSGTYYVEEKVEIKETYEIMTKVSMMEQIILKNFIIGVSGGLVVEAESACNVNIVWDFNKYSGCTIYTDFTGVNDEVLPFQDIMFAQQNKIVSPYKYYIPKTLPLSHSGFNYDFTSPIEIDSDAWSSRLNFTPDRTVDTGLLADRVLMINENLNFGFAFGYIPVGSNAPNVRRTNASRKALQLSNTSKKVYPSTIDRSDKTTFEKGDYYNAVAYRVYFELSDLRTGFYIVPYKNEFYVFLDWHNTDLLDKIDLDNKYNGMSVEVVETSANVEVLNYSVNGNLLCNVQTSGSYGYAILRLHN